MDVTNYILDYLPPRKTQVIKKNFGKIVRIAL